MDNGEKFLVRENAELKRKHTFLYNEMADILRQFHDMIALKNQTQSRLEEALSTLKNISLCPKCRKCSDLAITAQKNKVTKEQAGYKQ